MNKVSREKCESKKDAIAVEQPLEICIVHGSRDLRERESIAVTMRTPGNDCDLAIGFLFTEGIIQKYQDVVSVHHCPKNKEKNVVIVHLNEFFEIPELDKRNFYMTSSCGVCGKASIEAVTKNVSLIQSSIQISSQFIYKMVSLLSSTQKNFSITGGIHATALFENNTLTILKEDIGRHNAFDKVVGSMIQKTPLNNCSVMVSGRVSFELVQKAAMAGIPILTAIGAPSSLAIELAKKVNMTLIGFVRNNRFNIYCGHERILI